MVHTIETGENALVKTCFSRSPFQLGRQGYVSGRDLLESGVFSFRLIALQKLQQELLEIRNRNKKENEACWFIFLARLKK